MYFLCFNDSILKSETDSLLVAHLNSTLIAYKSLKEKHPEQLEGIVTDRSPKNVILNESNFTLADCIMHLEREMRQYAFPLFNKYPLDKFYNNHDDKELLELEYRIEVDGKSIDALNAKIAAINNGILFTFPVHPEYKKHKLVIIDSIGEKCEVLNHYGEKSNELFLCELIQAKVIEKLDGFEKLKAIVGNCQYYERFVADFNKLTHDTQTKLISELRRAIDRKKKTYFQPDGDLIKDVTPVNEKEVGVYELRIHNPVATRMYFYETQDAVYLASIEGKPNKRVQTNHINNAKSIIKELIAT